MKKFTGTWIVVAVFAALLAFLLVGKPKSRDEAKEASLTLLETDREALEKVTIANRGGELVLEKKDGVWRIAAPRELPVEESLLNQVKNALEELVASDLVWATPTDEDRKKAGLDAPEARVHFTAAGGKSGTLEVGRALPKGELRYVASSGKPGIFTIQDYDVEVFTKGLADFRRKKILDFERDDILTMLVEAPGREPLMLTRKDVLAPWMVSTPFTGRADRGRANGVLTKLSNLRALEFVEPPPQAEGLDGERGTFTLSGDGGKTWTVMVGAEKKDAPGRFYVRDGKTGAVAIADGPLPGDLKDPFSAWRDEQLFDFHVDDVRTLELVLDKGPLVVERNVDGMFATKGGEPKIVNAEATAVLRTARDAKVGELGPEAPVGSAKSRELGLETPVVHAKWTTGGDDPVTLELVVGATKPGTRLRWARTNESTNALLLDAEPIVKAAAELAAAPAKPAKPAESPAATPAATSKASPAPEKG